MAEPTGDDGDASSEEKPKKKPAKKRGRGRGSRGRGRGGCDETSEEASGVPENEDAGTVHYSQEQAEPKRKVAKRENEKIMKKPATAKKGDTAKQPAKQPKKREIDAVAGARGGDDSKTRKTFAGRRPPSSEHALGRFTTLQKTFMEDLAHHFDNPSVWEAGCVKEPC